MYSPGPPAGIGSFNRPPWPRGSCQNEHNDDVVRSVPARAHITPCELNDTFAMMARNNNDGKLQDSINHNKHMVLSCSDRHELKCTSGRKEEGAHFSTDIARGSFNTNSSSTLHRVSTTETESSLDVVPMTSLQRQVAACWIPLDDEDFPPGRTHHNNLEDTFRTGETPPFRENRRPSLLDDEEPCLWDSEFFNVEGSGSNVSHCLDNDAEQGVPRQPYQLGSHPHRNTHIVSRHETPPPRRVSRLSDCVTGSGSCHYQETPSSGSYLYREYYYGSADRSYEGRPEQVSHPSNPLSQGFPEYSCLSRQALPPSSVHRWKGSPLMAEKKGLMFQTPQDSARQSQQREPKDLRVPQVLQKKPHRSRTLVQEDLEDSFEVVPSVLSTSNYGHPDHASTMIPVSQQVAPVQTPKMTVKNVPPLSHKVESPFPFNSQGRKNTSSLIDDSDDDEQDKDYGEHEASYNYFLQSKQWSSAQPNRLIGSVVTPPPVTPTSFVTSGPTSHDAHGVVHLSGGPGTPVPTAPRKKIPSNHYSPIYPSAALDEDGIGDDVQKSVRPGTPFAVADGTKQVHSEMQGQNGRNPFCSEPPLLNMNGLAISHKPPSMDDGSLQYSRKDENSSQDQRVRMYQTLLPQRRGRSPFYPIEASPGPGPGPVSDHAVERNMASPHGGTFKTIGTPTGWGENNIFRRTGKEAPTPPVSNKKIKPSPKSSEVNHNVEKLTHVQTHSFFYDESTCFPPPTSPLVEPVRSATTLSSLTSPSGIRNSSPSTVETLSSCTGQNSTDAVLIPSDHTSLTSRLSTREPEGVKAKQELIRPQADAGCRAVRVSVLPQTISQSPLPETFGQVDTSNSGIGKDSLGQWQRSSGLRRHGALTSAFSVRAPAPFLPSTEAVLSPNQDERPGTPGGPCMYGQWSGYRPNTPSLFEVPAIHPNRADSAFVTPTSESAFTPPMRGSHERASTGQETSSYLQPPSG